MSTAEGHTVLQLLSNVLSDQLRVDIGGANFDDGEGDGLADHLLHGEAGSS